MKAEATKIVIRDSMAEDVAAIAAIYGHHVLTGLASFEEEAPSAEEMGQRRAEVLARRLPYLVATDTEGRVLGYAYASPYRTRSAYRFTLEDSIYIAPGAIRRGVGLALLQELVARCAAQGYRQMVAVIGDSSNHASIGLHERVGFVTIGILPAIGFKHGRWVDSVLMQRPLGAGSETPP